MTPLRRHALVAMCIAAALSMSGCWDVRDINDRTPALAMGLDYSQTSGWTVSLAEVILPPSGSAQYSGNLQVGQGTDLSDAIETLRSHLSRRLYLGSVKVYVFGSGALQQGRVREALHALSLHAEVNPTGYAMSVAGTAQTLLSHPDGAVNVMAVRLHKEFETQESLRDGHLNMPLWEAFRRSMAPNSALYLPVFAILPQSGAESSGTAVFGSDGHLALHLDRQESIALRWLLGIPGRSVLKLSDGTEVKTTWTSVKTRFVGKDPRKLSVTISAQAEAYLVPSVVIQTAMLQRLNQQAADALVRRSMGLVQKLQAAGTDVCEWHEAARRAGLSGFDMRSVQVSVSGRVTTLPRVAPAF